MEELKSQANRKSCWDSTNWALDGFRSPFLSFFFFCRPARSIQPRTVQAQRAPDQRRGQKVQVERAGQQPEPEARRRAEAPGGRDDAAESDPPTHRGHPAARRTRSVAFLDVPNEPPESDEEPRFFRRN